MWKCVYLHFRLQFLLFLLLAWSYSQTEQHKSLLYLLFALDKLLVLSLKKDYGWSTSYTTTKQQVKWQESITTEKGAINKSQGSLMRMHKRDITYLLSLTSTEVHITFLTKGKYATVTVADTHQSLNTKSLLITPVWISVHWRFPVIQGNRKTMLLPVAQRQ